MTQRYDVTVTLPGGASKDHLNVDVCVYSSVLELTHVSGVTTSYVLSNVISWKQVPV